ncbi:hypothetical protein BD779DRAFT_1669709 [Infundibulicybe gibba]|nr:hypothetical protein BD779DRAFT_1669709 [Infundibulicybe gibba]
MRHTYTQGRQSTRRCSPLNTAPGDILIEIANSLGSGSDLLNFCLTSGHVFAHTSSVLYSTVTLNSVEQCIDTFGMLHRRHDIARHVRKLVVRPQSKRRLGHIFSDTDTASSAVRELASSMRLDALTRFVWDADEMPYHDDMWFALRMGYLTSWTYWVLSHLKPGFYENHVDMFMNGECSIPKALGYADQSMPESRRMQIDGHSTLPADARHVVQGQWPKLQKLTLGDVSIDWVSAIANAGQKRPFISFLETHPNLQSLNISRHTIEPIHLASLTPETMQLTSFTGTLQQLQALPHFHHKLTSVTFREPMQTREVSALAVAGLLQSLTELTELKISFMLHSMYDSGNLLRSLIASCPRLRHLELTCGHKPSFQLDSFSKTIRGFPKLRTLHLTIVKYPGDETLASGATRIAKSNPQLEKFSLTFIPPAYPLPLPSHYLNPHFRFQPEHPDPLPSPVINMASH